MQKTAMNPNPEQEMAVNPFAQEQAAEIQPQENAQTYPVEVDGDIVELTLEELIEAAAQGLSKRNAYIRRNRAANAMPNGQIYAAFVEEYPDVRPEDIPQQVWEWAQQEGSLVSAYRKWEIAELRDELAALEMNQKNRRAAVGRSRTGNPREQIRSPSLCSASNILITSRFNIYIGGKFLWLSISQASIPTRLRRYSPVRPSSRAKPRRRMT